MKAYEADGPPAAFTAVDDVSWVVSNIVASLCLLLPSIFALCGRWWFGWCFWWFDGVENFRGLGSSSICLGTDASCS